MEKNSKNVKFQPYITLIYSKLQRTQNVFSGFGFKACNEKCINYLYSFSAVLKKMGSVGSIFYIIPKDPIYPPKYKKMGINIIY